jgi:hypothetical protein
VPLAAVKKYGLAIQYIENPSEAMQLAAIRKILRENKIYQKY